MSIEEIKCKRNGDGELLSSLISPNVLTEAQRSPRREYETDTQRGSASSIFLPRLLLTPPHPSVSGLQAPVSPLWFVSQLLSPSFLSLHHILFSFILSYGLSTHPSLCAHPSLSPCISKKASWKDKFTMAPPLGLASGPFHTSNMPGIPCAASHTFT